MPCEATAYVWELTRNRVPTANDRLDSTCIMVSLSHDCELAVRSAKVVHWADEMKADHNSKQLRKYDSIVCAHNDRKSFESRGQRSYDARLRLQLAKQDVNDENERRVA